MTEVVPPAAPDGAGARWSGAEITPVEQPVSEADEADEADEVAAVVLSVPGVAGLHGGAFGEVATYLPRRRVVGIRIDPAGTRRAGDPARIEVHIVARYPARVAVVADRIRSALSGLAGERTVDVFVEDYAAPHDPSPETGPVPPGA